MNAEQVALTRRELANAIRALSMDAVQRANSGHPGMPMGMADIAQVLWSDFLKHNPNNPKWVDRDRFVVSNGHGSMLLYSLLHLSGYDLSIEDIKNFRQLHSKTPGHPEFGYTPGVETTTGPLGQGLSNAVGMAIAEKILAARFNRPGHSIVDHYTYVFLGDGCLMEGISHEACSLAGTLGLGKLISFWDDNSVSIDGDVSGWFTDDTPARFEAYGWHVIPNVDGHDADQVNNAIKEAQAHNHRPTLICCKTVIGWGSPNKQGSATCHGAALGEEEVALVRETIGWHYAPFEIPDGIYTQWDARVRGSNLESEWVQRFKAYKAEYPEPAGEFERRIDGELPAHWEKVVTDFIQQIEAEARSDATRKFSQSCLNAYAAVLPEMIGGSADLTGSNNTTWSGSTTLTSDPVDANYVYYGVREFAMSAVMNGIALHGGFIPYGGTFLVFSDYARNAVRMAALMGVRSIFVYTHDSIGLGEDGPTHQPVEQAASIRLIPNLSVWRPCDGVESAVAWQRAIERRQGPSALLFTRQSVAHQHRTPGQIENIKRGGYILVDTETEPSVIVIATGSEVELAVEAARHFPDEVRVVSMPSTDVFDEQDEQYKHSVLPVSVDKRIAIEAGVADYWRKYVGLTGRIIGLNSFGESAPAKDLFSHFGFNVDKVTETIANILDG
ncbi:MAG: transketolase [Arenicellales bacterium]|nr:transketolase [Arenicellales bacterium]